MTTTKDGDGTEGEGMKTEHNTKENEMAEQEIIAYLKSNTAAYCLMPKECRTYLEGKTCLRLMTDGNFGHIVQCFQEYSWQPTYTFRLHADYQPPTPDKWWFLPPSSSNEFSISHWATQPGKVDGVEWREVSAEFAAYLNAKPDGECDLREVEDGDLFYTTFKAWYTSSGGRQTSAYRWCKPQVAVEDFQRENARLREKYAEAEARSVRLEVITRERDELKLELDGQREAHGYDAGWNACLKAVLKRMDGKGKGPT